MFRYDQPFRTYSLSNLPMLYCQEEILQRRTEQVEQLRRRWDRLTKGLTFCEIHRFNNDRQQSLASSLLPTYRLGSVQFNFFGLL